MIAPMELGIELGNRDIQRWKEIKVDGDTYFPYPEAAPDSIVTNNFLFDLSWWR